MVYHFKIHKEKNGFWAECVELIGCQTQAKDLNQLKSYMEEALNLYLSEPDDSPILFTLPKKKIAARNIVRVPVDPSVAFSFLLRKKRLEENLTMREMAQKLQYKSINAYAKLEKGSTANPELRTLSKIKKIFSDFPIELVLAS